MRYPPAYFLFLENIHSFCNDGLDKNIFYAIFLEQMDFPLQIIKGEKMGNWLISIAIVMALITGLIGAYLSRDEKTLKEKSTRVYRSVMSLRFSCFLAVSFLLKLQMDPYNFIAYSFLYIYLPVIVLLLGLTYFFISKEEYQKVISLHKVELYVLPVLIIFFFVIYPFI